VDVFAVTSKCPPSVPSFALTYSPIEYGDAFVNVATALAPTAGTINGKSK
jgi:hypothetical protein